MRSAIEALAAEKYYEPSLQAAGRDLIMEGVVDTINTIKTMKDLKNKEVKKNLITKLETINLIPMFPDEILNATKIQELYEELNVDGSESLVELYLAIGKHNRKLYNEKPTSWMKFLQKMLSNYQATYDERTAMCYERSRFFNMNTIYKETVYGLNTGISRYLKKELNGTNCCTINNAILADENYVRWEANGGKERQLSAFKLTNRQMVWVVSAYRFTSKYHERVPKTYDAAPRLQIDYLHVRYKNIKRFREAFNCGNLTVEGKMLYEEFKKKNFQLKKMTK